MERVLSLFSYARTRAVTPQLTTTEEESHLDAGVSSELDGGVVVAGAEEVVDQHAVETSLAPLRAHHRHLAIVLLQVIDAALTHLRRVNLLLNVLLRLHTSHVTRTIHPSAGTLAPASK